MPGLKIVKIIGSGFHVPETIVANEEFVKRPELETTDEWIVSMTGVKERRKVTDELASDLGMMAAQKALDNAGLEIIDIDLIITATATPDNLFPATACNIQEKLMELWQTKYNRKDYIEMKCFDEIAGCTGSIFALETAMAYLQANKYATALVIGTEVLTSITNYNDRQSCILFGDGAGALVLTNRDGDGHAIVNTYCRSNGKIGKGILQMPGPEIKSFFPVEAKNVDSYKIIMKGNRVFPYAVRKMEEAVNTVIFQAGLKLEDINLIIPHQANSRIIETIREKLGLTKDKFFVNIEKYGNTSSASVLIALVEAEQQGKIKKGDWVVLTGFGAGLTWGAILVKW